MPPKGKKKVLPNNLIVAERKPVDLQEIAKRQANKINDTSQILNRSSSAILRKHSIEPQNVEKSYKYELDIEDLTMTPPFLKTRTQTPTKNYNLTSETMLSNPLFSKSSCDYTLQNPKKSESKKFGSSLGLDLSKIELKNPHKVSDYYDYQKISEEMRKRSEEEYNHKLEILSQKLAKEYKQKYKLQLQELITRQNEIHNFQTESLKRQYEAKLSKYRELIIKMQKENEELIANKPEKLIVDIPIVSLEDENMWLKEEIKRLKSKKFTANSDFTLGRIPSNLYDQ